MFTGLVEGVGRVREVEPIARGQRLSIAPPWPPGELARGASVAVDGVCLTVVAFDDAGFEAQVVAETLACSTLGGARPGQGVNLERALRVGDRLGGHFVQGHVDATATVLAAGGAAGDYRLRLELPPGVRGYVARKGSIAVQGVSLTVAAVTDDWFEVALVPETLQRTTLAALAAGDRANIEVDLLARYLERLWRETLPHGTAEPPHEDRP